MSLPNPPQLRLNQFLRKVGVAESRRKADTLVESGRVRVNGVTITQHGVRVTAHDRVECDGVALSYPAEKRVLIALNKPKGYITTASDTHARDTVYELLPSSLRSRVHAIGRLDKDTTGLLLFTNDGELTYQLTHPSFQHEKEYELTIRGDLQDTHQQAFRQGMLLDDGLTAPAQIDHIEQLHTQETHRPHHARRATRFRLTITEGRKRQIRRMCKHLQIHLIHLHRVRVGPYLLGSLRQGQWQHLSIQDLPDTAQPDTAQKI